MADIIHHLPIKASEMVVFQAVSTPDGLDAWWTKTSMGVPELGAEFELGFGQGFNWRAVVSSFVPGTEFELKLTQADEDWQGTRARFNLEEKDGVTIVSFLHSGWPEKNEHYKVSCYCWALYLRLLRRYVELGEVVAYEERLDA